MEKLRRVLAGQDDEEQGLTAQAIPLGPVTGHHREEISVYPSTSPHEEAEDCNEVSPQTPLRDTPRSLMPQHSALVLESDGLPYALSLASCALFLYSLSYIPFASLPPEAIRVLQRRSLERQRGQITPAPGGRATLARRGGGDLRALLKVSLLNDQHRYDDEEYEEEEEAGAAADEGLVRKCTEWLRGVENAVGRDHPERLETLPHLGTL
ncbi:hypothetical protein BTVI_100479 [Pitangus sulphuratus]|nr:hypothetical protein BTVI_100479 [Pitangus sulphuratus]